MSIEFHVKYPGIELPELQPGHVRYVLAREGTYLERCTATYRSSALVSGPLPLLDSHRQSCVLRCGKIPLRLAAQMLGFFQEAYSLHGGEAALILLYHPQQRLFRWHCPVQEVEVYQYLGRLSAGDSVEYENPLELPAGYVHFGDAHSHIGHEGPSSVDRWDERHQDGLHLVVGQIARRPTCHVDFAIDGQRFNVPPEMILAGLPASPYPKPPREWLECIRLKIRPTWYGSYSTQYGSTPSSGTAQPSGRRWDSSSGDREAGRDLHQDNRPRDESRDRDQRRRNGNGDHEDDTDHHTKA